MRNKRVWDAVNKMPVYAKKSKLLTEKQVKRVLLDHSEVNPNCPESVRKYGERCQMIGELYQGYKEHIKCQQTLAKERAIDNVAQHTTEEIKRLIGYKDEYIG
jgi:hypothetical protein